ncbi:MAG: hypothetical protein ABIY37_04075 [Devosia sp.]
MTAHLPMLGAVAIAALLLPCSTGIAAPLKQAKIIIEHNATDEDTGFQAFVDADGWERLEIIGPSGVVAQFNGHGTVKGLGMTELFFETTEPENAKLALDDVLGMLPAGDYEFRATYSALGGNSGTTSSTATLSHTIPQGVTLVAPKEGAVLRPGDVTVTWTPVEKALDGSNVTIIAYQLIIEKDEEPHPRMIGKRGLSMYLPASVSEMSVSAAFFEPGTPYMWEVLAIEEGGNQTLQSGTFSTQ